MKWLFSFLLVANLGMFIWLFPQHDVNVIQAQRLADVGQLRLVSEIHVEVKKRSSEILVETESVPQVATNEAETSVESAAADATDSQEVPASAETDEQDRAESGMPDQSREMAEPEDELRCASIGAFNKRSQAEVLSVNLLAQGIKSEITSEAVNEQAGFWVLIPPQSDREAAIAIAKDLEKAGIADIWRFTSGKLAHAISLGLFRDEERAQARRDTIAGMGFEPEVQPRFREQTRYWLNYEYTGESPLSDDLWQELKEEIPELELDEAPCR